MLVVQDYKGYRICEINDLLIISNNTYDEEKKKYKYAIRSTDSNYDLGVYYGYERAKQVFDEIKEILEIKTNLEYFSKLPGFVTNVQTSPEQIEELIKKISCYQFPKE